MVQYCYVECLLIALVTQESLVSGFRWGRRKSIVVVRGGSDDAAGNFNPYDPHSNHHPLHNHHEQQQEQQYRYNEQEPPLPDFPQPPPGYARHPGQQTPEPPFPGEQQQQHDTSRRPQPQRHPYSGSSSQQLPDPPPLPDPSAYAGIEDLQPSTQQDDPYFQPAPQHDTSWDTTSDTQSSSNVVKDLSSFDKEYILKGLARLYRKKILPLELSSKYGHFHSPPLSPSDFDAPPMILLLGQYSVGKTSFVKYLLGRDFPGIRVGPEPTTDRFTAVLWGNQDKIVPGAALCSQADRPFTGLSPFGNNFLSRMEGTELNAPILKNVTIVDTPGILSGQKQKSRNYDYEAVMRWFAERADLIIVMFDAHKLDISDELKSVMQLMIPHLDKIRIVLNKADSISTQQLMRVYGALMWSLGKVMNTPEVSRVYIGSFWDAPIQNEEQSELLQREELDLLHDIMALPQHAVMRKINELVKRARSVKVHAYIIHYLRKQMPSYQIWKTKAKQQKLIRNLEQEFLGAARRYNLPKGDFPSLEPMRQALMEIKDLNEFPKLDKRLVREMDKVFSVDIPELLERAKNH